MLIIIDNYDSFTFNVVQYFKQLQQEVRVLKNDQISAKKLFDFPLNALVVSPGPCTPSQAGISNDAIKIAIEKRIPVLGVCLGYQCIGEIFGGRIIHAPCPMHGKISEIYHDGKTIFDKIPSPFKAVRYHSLILESKALPECLDVIAITNDIASGGIDCNVPMAIQHKTLPVYGVQYHPESVLSEYGHQVLQNFLSLFNT